MATVTTNAGKTIKMNRIRAIGTEPVFIGWGTGAGTAAIADTTLFTEASEARVTGTSSVITTTTTNDTYQLIGTLTVAGAGKTITNAGNLDASTGGGLHIHGDFTGLVLNIGDSIKFTFRDQHT